MEFIKTENNENPLIANEVRHDSTEGSTSAKWNIILSNQTKADTIDGRNITYGNFHTYGGVIGKMKSSSVLEVEFTDNSTDIGAFVKRSTAQGILCGEMESDASLTARYKNTTRTIQVGNGANTHTGGLIGCMNGASFTLKPESSGLNFDVKSGSQNAGLIAGYAKASSTITLPDNVSFSGTVISTGERAGGIVGSLEQSDIKVGETGTGSITLSGVEVSGTNKVGGVIGYDAPSANNSNSLKNITYNMTNCTVSGNNSGGIIGEYLSVGDEEIDVSKFVFSGTKLAKGNAGGIFGIYTASGNTTISGTFNAPESSVNYGGVIGKYDNNVLTRSLILQNLTVNTVKQTSGSKSLGGVVLEVSGVSYINVDGVTVNVTGGADKSSTSNPFGGIVSTIGASAETGSWIDVTRNFTLTTNSAYNGGAVAGSFKNGVLRLAGITDISGAQTANGYGQLIYENDNTLVYAKGSGSDSSWTFKRNANTTASDLGQWGEVVRLFDVPSEDQTGTVAVNAEDAEIVTADSTNHTVTLAKAVKAITDTTSFAKLALNIQLNDGINHGALCFTNPETPTEENPLLTKTQLLDSAITVSSSTVDLKGTGLLGLMRDGGNGKYLKSADDTFQGSPDFFTGSITGTANSSTGEIESEIKLAVGEVYGCDANGTALEEGAVGGRIYLSNNWGHDAQGLLSFGDGASLSTLNISGKMHVSRTAGSNHLYVAPAIGAMTNGATLNNVNITTKMTIDKANDSKFYVGGVSGVFDGSTSGTYTLSITGGTIKPEIELTGTVGSDDSHNHENNNTYAGGVLGLLKGESATQYKVTMSSTDISPKITLGSDVGNVNNSFIGGVIGYVLENTTNEREISFDTVTMTGATVKQKSKYSGGLLGAFWDRTKVTIDNLTISDSEVDNQSTATDKLLSGLVYRATGNWAVNALSISATGFTSSGGTPVNFGLIVNEAYHGDDGLYLNLKNSGYTLNTVSIPSSTKTDYYVDEIAAKTAKDANAVITGGNGVGIININMNSVDSTTNALTTNTSIVTTGTYQNQTLSGNKLIANQYARYYYNLDTIKASESPADGENFLMWSIYNHYAPENIQGYDVLTNPDISTLTNIDLSALSYYPVNITSVTLPSATFTFGFNAIKTNEEGKTPDNWARYPDATGDMTKTTETQRRNQHYLMQNGLFRNVTGTLSTDGRITFAGDFGGIGNAGVLIGETLTGAMNLQNGVTLKNVKPYSADSPMLVYYINGTAADINPQFTLKGLRQEDYPSSGTTAVASALIYNAEGTNMNLIFSDLKLDARDGTANIDLNSVYNTSRSIFRDATLFKSLKSNSSDTIEYNYTWDEDWGTDTQGNIKRNVTYGKEVNVATNAEYPYYYKDEDETTPKSGERRYSGTKRYFTNPTVNTDTEYDFSTGFLPYVQTRNLDTTYNISEVKVNFVSNGLVDGCGTYNDPYIITSAKLLAKVANYINSPNAVLDTIRLPNALNATWHDETTGDSLYHKNDTTKGESSSRYYLDTTETTGITSWDYSTTREYLAGAYYVISDDMTLDSNFAGIGKGGSDEKGKTVFHGVIVGQKKEDNTYPQITNLSTNPFIYISNGSVIKNLNFKIDNTKAVNNTTVVPISISQSSAGSGADYTYSYKDITNTDSNNKTAKYYGGVFGEIMGGDNIIDGSLSHIPITDLFY